ncbi:putative quinol monooxygenase [Agrobacterium larrymoorei]|uniref:putative quinol monooxygenase n=1 Tax=Agrobacterium larrymoorei TaxID=160699 RepID=UPI0030C19EBB
MVSIRIRMGCEASQAETLFRELIILQQETRLEPGNISFDVFRSSGQQTSFLLLEEFRDEEAVAAHRSSNHFAAFKHKTASLALTLERYMPAP